MARLFKGYGDTKFTSKWRGKRAIVFTITAISLIDLVFHASRWVEPSAPIAWLTSGPAFFQRDTSSTNETNWKICQECNINDSIPGRYINSIHFGTPVPTLDRLQKGKVTKAEVAKYLLNNVILESNLNPVFLPDTARATLFSSYLSDPDSLLSFSFSSLRPLLPTMYLFTRTGSTGRLSGPGKRLRYMNRHISMLKDYQELVRTEGYGDGANIEMGERQLLWIVVEDEPHLETGLNTLLQQSKIPFIYIAHGPTNRWGKAQWNMVLKTIDVLRHSMFGDGPVMNLDDDALVLPELFRRLWKIKQAIAWQVGNLYTETEVGISYWEGPFYKDGNLLRWHVGGRAERKIRVDLNAFAINSTLIGEGLPYHGPQYILNDLQAGESEFLEKIIANETELEPLCLDTRKEHCFLAWHNHWMPEDWDPTHPPPCEPEYEDNLWPIVEGEEKI